MASYLAGEAGHCPLIFWGEAVALSQTIVNPHVLLPLLAASVSAAISGLEAVLMHSVCLQLSSFLKGEIS